MRPSRPASRRRRSIVAALLLALLPAGSRAQGGAAQAPALPQPTVRITAGAGLLYMHLPAFSYTEGSARRPAVNEAQEAASVGFNVGLEGYRGRAVIAGRFLSAFDVLDDRWAYAGLVTAGVAKHGARSTLTIAAGPTLVYRERVPDSFLSFRGLCSGVGCDNAPNNDAGTLTSGGVALTASGEIRLRGVVGLGAEFMAASGAQRYVGGGVRVTIGR